MNTITKTFTTLTALALISGSAGAALLTPTSVVATDADGGNIADNTINSSGLNAPFDETATHDTLNYWQAFFGNEITFNLGAEYNLTGTWIWNYNNPDSSPRGVSDFDIYVGGSGDSAASTLNKSDALISQNSIGVPNTAEFEPFVASNVQYIRFVPLTAGPNDRIGLGEVRFVGTAVPEPTSLALLGLGGLLIARRRRT